MINVTSHYKFISSGCHQYNNDDDEMIKLTFEIHLLIEYHA